MSGRRAKLARMAKLYFYYASMNAGKSTNLLQADFNYRERGMGTMLFTAAVHDRSGVGMIDSRIGLMASAYAYAQETDLRAAVEAELRARRIDCVLVDEAQFLSARQVRQLASICDDLEIPVLAYGLRTDFQGQLFEGSGALLALADTLVELKAVCECGRKAIMNLRVDGDGRAVKSGAQTEVGGNERYVALCRRHFMQRIAQAEQSPLPLELASTPG
jgi:thymidine kinase